MLSRLGKECGNWYQELFVFSYNFHFKGAYICEEEENKLNENQAHSGIFNLYQWQISI